MKTSNKLVIAGIGLLMVVVVVNAFALRNRFAAMAADTQAALRNFTVTGFDRVELVGTAPRAMGLHVNVTRADRPTVHYSNRDFIHIEQTGTTLKIKVDHPKKYETDVRQTPTIHIECPGLIAFTAIGTQLDSLDLPEKTYPLMQQMYRRSTVNIRDFALNQLKVTAENGMEVTLDHMKIDSLSAIADRTGKVELRQSELAHANLNVGDESTVMLDQTQVGTLSTDIAEKGELTIKGNQLMTAHGTKP